jgi:mRNA interferase MazF
MRGDIFELRANPNAKGHEQRGRRYAVVLQSDTIPLSTVIAAPTTTHSWGASFHPEITFNGQSSRILIEQMVCVDPTVRFKRKVGRVSPSEQIDIDQAVKLVLGLF